MNRHDDDAAKKAVRKEFTIAKMFECLKGIDATLEVGVSGLYERTIDAGAHPNVGAIAGAASVTRTPEKLQIKLAYLNADLELIKGTMKSAAQSGLSALLIFRHVYRERYDLLGISAKIPGLRAGL